MEEIEFQNEWQVFISCKIKDSNNDYTRDWYLAKELYEFLVSNCFKVFMSDFSINKSDFKKVIYEALDRSIVLIVVATTKENISSRWVEEEWDCFIGEINDGRKKGEVFTYVEGLSIGDLPLPLRKRLSFSPYEESKQELLNKVRIAIQGSNGQISKNIAEDGNSRIESGLTSKREPEHRLKALKSPELTKIGFSTTEIVETMIEIDYQTIGDLDEHHEGTLSQWAEIHDTFPEGCCLLLDTQDNNRIVGYWHLVPIDDEALFVAKRGELYDGDLSVDSMTVLGFPGDYNIYIAGVAVLPKYRSVLALRLLFDKFISTIKDLAEQDIFIKEMVANALTPEGNALCKSARMKFICPQGDQANVYQLEMRTLKPPFNRDRDLDALYNEHFGNQ